MGNFFAQRQEPLPVLAFGLDCSGLTTTLYRLRSLGFLAGDITYVVPTIGFGQELATVKPDKSAGFAPLEITSWVRPLPPITLRGYNIVS